MRKMLFAAALVSVLFAQVSARCECGYSVNSTNPKTDHAIFTQILETSFIHLAPDALDWNNRQAVGWARQVYHNSAQASRNGGHYGQNVSAANVVINPMRSQYDWAGPSVLSGDAGLQMWTRAEVLDGEISSGQIATLRNDILYGSFRVGAKMTMVPGTCGAFFWYHNDSQEIDFEYLSYQQSPNDTSEVPYHPLNLVIQTPQSAAAGFNAAGTPNYDVVPLPFDPADGFHEYRFDWTPTRVTFYADGHWLSTMTFEIPTSPGQLFLNHWSNGNPGWSRGPPLQDALMTVSYVKAYFNTTSSADMDAYAEKCIDRFPGKEAGYHICVIPDELVAPDPSGPTGNNTAETFFFTPQGDYNYPPRVRPNGTDSTGGTKPSTTTSSGDNGTDSTGTNGTGSANKGRAGLMSSPKVAVLLQLVVVMTLLMAML